MRRRVGLHMARAVMVLSLAATCTFVAVYVVSFYRSESLVRSRWSLSSDIDATWHTGLTIERGLAHFDHTARVEPAFVSPFTGNIAHSSDRTKPVGARWMHGTASPKYLDPVVGNSPALLRRWGVAWQTPVVVTIFGDYTQEAWWVRVNLAWIILMSLLANVLTIVIWRRVGRPVRRIRAGLCFRCGYDLRSSRHRCPECGATAPSAG